MDRLFPMVVLALRACRLLAWMDICPLLACLPWCCDMPTISRHWDGWDNAGLTPTPQHESSHCARPSDRQQRVAATVPVQPLVSPGRLFEAPASQAQDQWPSSTPALLLPSLLSSVRPAARPLLQPPPPRATKERGGVRGPEIDVDYYAMQHPGDSGQRQSD